LNFGNLYLFRISNLKFESPCNLRSLRRKGIFIVKPTIDHTTHNYIGLSETFIYSYLKNLKRHNSIVLTAKAINLEQFPFSLIYDSS